MGKHKPSSGTSTSRSLNHQQSNNRNHYHRHPSSRCHRRHSHTEATPQKKGGNRTMMSLNSSKKYSLLLTITLLMATLTVASAFVAAPASAQAATDWPMFHHDPAHT